MRYPFNEVYSLSELNHPIPSTIIQEQIAEGVHVYSLAKDTSMSPESFDFYKMLFVKSGKFRVTIKNEKDGPIVNEISVNEGIITPRNKIIAIEAIEDSVYLEVMLGQIVNHTIEKPCDVFKVGDIGHYEEGKWIETPIIISGFVEVKMITFDKSCEPLEKILPAAALMFVYEGKGVIECDGKPVNIKAGDSMRFMKGTHAKLYPKDGNMKIGVTQFFIG